MKILFTNDDGISSPGIAALVKAFAGNEIYVAAPDRQRSANSHCVTYFHDDLICTKVDLPGANKAYAISGTPADCVYGGVNGLYQDQKFDLVVSGINQGINACTDVLYSGTIGAAEEGLSLGIPSMAVSLCSYTDQHFGTAAEIAVKWAEMFLKDKDNLTYLPSINVPAIPKEQIKGIRITHFAPFYSYGRPLEERKEDGKVILHLSEMDVDRRTPYDPYSDMTAIEDGYVSITPISFDAVNHSIEKRLAEQLSQM